MDIRFLKETWVESENVKDVTIYPQEIEIRLLKDLTILMNYGKVYNYEHFVIFSKNILEKIFSIVYLLINTQVILLKASSGRGILS
jgi:hypothetical protein